MRHDAYALIRDEKAANTEGGTFTQGAWRTRDLNTEVFDADGIVSISSNQFTLAAGTYFIYATAPAFMVGQNKLRLRNITDSTDAIIGNIVFASSAHFDGSLANLVGRVTIAGTKTFELQHYGLVTRSTDGFGSAMGSSVAVEVYAQIEIWREAAGDKAISDLSAATTLEGTEELLLNDDGTSKRITVDDFASAMGSGGGGIWDVLHNETLTSSGTFDVQSISPDYEDLQVILLARSTRSDDYDSVLFRFNNDSGTNYNSAGEQTYNGSDSKQNKIGGTSIPGNGLSDPAILVPAANSPSGYAGSLVIDIAGYSQTTLSKPLTAQWGASLNDSEGNTRNGTLIALWKSTSAINRIAFFTGASASFVAGSRLVILGRKAEASSAGLVIAARATRATDQSISDSVWTAMSLTTETFDTGAMHDNSTNPSRITVSHTGKYVVAAAINFAANTNGARYIALAVNGSRIYQGPTNAGASIWSREITDVISLTAGDYVEVHAYQDSGGALNATGYLSVTTVVGGGPTDYGLVTALPSSPSNQDTCTYTDSLTAPTYQWRLQYVAAKSADKWIYVGGSGAYDIVGTPESTSSSTPVNLSTTGPDFTIPVDGDYTLEFGCHHDTSSSTGGGQMGLSINGAAPAYSINMNASTTAGREVGSHVVQADDLNASDTVVAKYAQLDGVGNARFYARWLRVTPRAVGG